jgi:hypothetical protein
VCISVISVTWKAETGGLSSDTGPEKNVKAYVKNKQKQKRADGVTQVVEYLPSKIKALSSKSSNTEKK